MCDANPSPKTTQFPENPYSIDDWKIGYFICIVDLNVETLPLLLTLMMLGTQRPPVYPYAPIPEMQPVACYVREKRKEK